MQLKCHNITGEDVTSLERAIREHEWQSSVTMMHGLVPG